MISDARVRYTRMVIKNSFMELLKDHPVNKITVKDVCEMAEINRATFYKHYTDCFDLLSKIEDEMICELEQLVQVSQHKNITDLFQKMFNKIKESGTSYLTIVSDHGDRTFSNRILKTFYEQAFPSFESQLPNGSKQKKEWLYYFSANGCSGILTHWISSGMKADTKEISEFIAELLRKLTA